MVGTTTVDEGPPAPVKPARRTRIRRWLRNALIAVAVLVVLIAVLGFIVVPRVAKTRIEALALADLGRRATIGTIEFNPFTLHARLADFRLADRDPSRTLFAFDALDVRVSAESLWRLAPVIDSVTLTRPRLNLARSGDDRLNVQDLLDRPSAQPPGATPKFSVDNIEIDDGTVTFEDGVRKRKVVLSSLDIGIPFLSSFAHDAKIRVTPHLDGVIDGSRFALSGSTSTPFAATQEATLAIDLDALKVADYASYVELPRGLKLASGALTTRLRLAFVSGPSGPRTVTLSGMARLDGVKVDRRDGSMLAGVHSLTTELASANLLAHTIAFDRISVDAPKFDLRRDAEGRLEVEQVFGAKGAPRAAKPSRAAEPPGWTIEVAAAEVRHGGVEWTDASVPTGFHATLSNLSIDGSRLSNRAAGGTVKIGFDVDRGAHVDGQATLDIAGNAARGNVSVSKLDIARFAPYFPDDIDAEVRSGTLDAGAAFTVAAQASSAAFSISDGKFSLDGVNVARRGERSTLLTLKHVEAAGVAVEPSTRSVTVESASWIGGKVSVERLANGTFDAASIFGGGNPANAKRPPGDAPPASNSSARRPAEAWSVSLRHANVEQVEAEIVDRVPKQPVKLRVAATRISVEGLSTAKGAHSRVVADVRVGKTGRVHVAGSFGVAPAVADLRVDAKGIDLVTLEPYLEARTNVTVTRGMASAAGRLTIAMPAAGPPRVSFAGKVSVDDFDSLDRPTARELLRWKSLALTGVDIKTEPLAIDLGTIALDHFYARIILSANATLNLQDLLAPQSVQSAQPAQSAPAETGGPLPVSIAGIRLSDGEVEYSDFFVKPNYETHLTAVTGTVSALTSSLAGNVSLAAKVQGNAPVDIRGTISPFASNLQLDLTAKASDVELPPLTPYSIKYAGYGIEKGKLSMEVHYKIDDRKLTASNKLRLDQLTFGDHVDSPTATKLPVLLAVSLLKDRNGVINLDLPIEGTLDDPQFSIWRVVVQVFVNLITKAVTAPFALLGSIAGGSHEQLSWVGFAAGHADLSKAAQEKLATLAKALSDRPALRLDIAGRAIADLDRDALKHVRLESAMRARKLKDLAAEGSSAPPADEITIGPAEYPKYLAEVYGDARISDKPRNFLGVAKKIPPEEMERLLLASYAVDDAALTALANQRASAVKAWLIGAGRIDPARLFLVAPKLSAQGIADKGETTRVDFTLK